MDRAKAAVYLVGLFGVATLIEAVGLASMAGFEPQLSVFFGGGLLLGGVAVRTLNKGCYEEFDLFRRRDVAFWGVTIGVLVYISIIPFQFF